MAQKKHQKGDKPKKSSGEHRRGKQGGNKSKSW